jgi:hypothetical protein
VPQNPADIFTVEYLAGQAGLIVSAILNFVLVSGVATAAVTRAIADNYLGEPVSIGGSYRRIGRSWLPLLGTLFVAALVGIALFIWFLVPCVGWLSGMGILTFYGAVVVPLLAPIVVLERRSGLAALRRAWDLVRSRFWWVVGFALVLYLLNVLLIGGPIGALQAVFQAFVLNAARDNQLLNLLTIQSIVQGLLSVALSLLYLPVQLTAMTLLYFDLRIRSEGIDLALQAEPDAASASEALTRAPVTVGTSLVTLEEMGKFVLVSLGFVGIYVALFVVVGGMFAALLAVAANF